MVPELESPEVADAARAVREAVENIDLGGADVVVVVSPHAEATGAYDRAVGSLKPFGVEGVDIDQDAVAVPGLAALHDRVDHGIVVPLRLLGWEGPVAAIGIQEGKGMADLVSVERAITAMTERVAVVASANLSAGLGPRAPLTEVEGAREAESAAVSAFTEDAGSLVDGARALMKVGSCSAPSLTLLGRLFRGRPGRVLAHEAPVGVGYLAAEVT